MKPKLFFIPAVLIFVLHAGCAVFLLGAGAAGGYAISKDEVESLNDTSYTKVWRAAKEVLRKEGVITLEDQERGRLEGLVQKSTVETRIEEVTPKTTRLRLKARKTKGLFPDIELAQKLHGQVMRRL